MHSPLLDDGSHDAKHATVSQSFSPVTTVIDDIDSDSPCMADLGVFAWWLHVMGYCMRGDPNLPRETRWRHFSRPFLMMGMSSTIIITSGCTLRYFAGSPFALDSNWWWQVILCYGIGLGSAYYLQPDAIWETPVSRRASTASLTARGMPTPVTEVYSFHTLLRHSVKADVQYIGLVLGYAVTAIVIIGSISIAAANTVVYYERLDSVRLVLLTSASVIGNLAWFAFGTPVLGIVV
jgi:hypothetical protein